MQDTEWEDVVVNNTVADTEWEDVNPVTESVLDNEDGKIYNVPVAMDGIDTKFAIDTQHKGADKSSFFGKINFVGQRLEQGWNDMSAGVLEHVRATSDTIIANAYNEQEKIARLQEAKRGDFSSWNREFTEEEKAEKIKYLEENTKWIKALRERNKSFWDKGIEILSPEEKQNSLTPFFRGLGGATASVGETAAAVTITKSPAAASALVGYLYGKIKETEYFDKAIEDGTSARAVQRDADIAGIIEGGIELVGDRILIGIGKIPQIQQISNRVVSSAMVKAFKDKVGKEAVKKIASKHLESVGGAALKGFGTEFSEEALQSYLGDVWEVGTGISTKSNADMLSDALFSGFIGGISGAGFGVSGTSTYNREIRNTNAKLKKAVKDFEPNLTEEETQSMADFLQEALYQEGNSYMQELNTVLEKETMPDVMPEGIDAKALTEQTRKTLKENYGMSDEDIDKTINISLGMIDARNQFNEVYTEFRNKMESIGARPVAADSYARMIAARALSIARDEKMSAKEVAKRFNLQFKRMKFEDFQNEANPQYNPVIDDFIPFQTVLAKKTDVSTNVDPKQIRKDAKKYLLDKVRKQDITHPKLGKIRVSRKGIDEFINTSGNIDKLALVPHLKELIETSRVGEKEDLTHPREDNIVAFYPLYNDAVIDGKPYDVTTKIGVDREGNLFYTVLLDENSSENGGVGNKSTVANEAINVSITPSAQNVNQNVQFQKSLNIAQENAELDKVNPKYEGETININGVERTVYNSNSDRIAMSEPALRNFYKWFGDSKVVDKEGRPLVMYHGTNKKFEEFDKSFIGKKHKNLYQGKGFYFTKEYYKAQNYGRKIMPVYLKIENPALSDYDLKPENDGIYAGQGVYVAFEPNQIKSTSNRGTYSESDNIYLQSAFAGSPVDYDRPSLEAIGSGEGNQAHGYGLYYALDREVAEGYRERSFSRKKFTEVQSLDQEFGNIKVNGQPLLEVYDIDISRNILETLLYKPYGEVEAELENKINQWQEFLEKDDYPYKKYAEGKIDAYTRLKDDLFNSGMSLIKQDLGQVHEVDIPENPYLLDEDLTFNEQPEFVKEKLKEVLMDDAFSKFFDDWGSAEEFAKVELDDYNQGMTGGNIYDRISDMLGSDRAASTILEKHGIKGITYVGDIDGRCFVIFNPDDVKVIQKFYQDGSNDPKGAYYKNTIYLFENADASTLIHELGHFFIDDLMRYGSSEETKKQLQAIYDYVGSKDGKLTREQHELFADAFELYVYEGKAPNSLLGKVFERFKHWLFKLKQEISRLGYVKINDDIRKLFDEMLGGRGLDFAMQMSGVRMAEALDGGTIPHHVIDRAIKLIEEGKMSKSDMDDLISRMKSGELKRKEFASELKKFEAGNVKHKEQLNPFDTMKYRSILSKGNFSKKDVIEKINRLLKWAEPRSRGGKLVGRFSDINMNRELAHIRELMNMDKEQAKEKTQANVELINSIMKGTETGDAQRLAFDNKILSIVTGKASAKVVLEVYNAISDSYNIGRLTSAITGEAKRMRKNRLIDEAIEVLTNNGTVNWREEKGKTKKFINQLGISQMSWQGILDILSMNDKSSKTGQSKLSKNLDVFDAEQKEARGVADDGEKVSKFIENKLKGVGNSQIAVSRYVNSKLDKKFTIEWGKNKKTFTKDQLLDIYMKSKDPETREIMANDEILQYNDDFLNEVNLILTAEDRAVAEALFDFYADNHAKINEFYEDKYGISLPKRDFYSPRSMERGGVNVDTGDLASYAGFSNVKERKAKAGSVKVKGAFQVLQEYIINSNHWIAWSDKLIDINAVMGDVKVKEIIKGMFGDNVVERIGYEVSRMASNDKFQSKMGWGKLFNKVRSNYAVSVLGIKPSLAIKQLTSFPAYLEYITPAEFMTGLADFAVNMKEAVETLGNTTLMKTRDVNIIKDFAELSKLELFKKGTTKVKLREFMMANIKLGDRGAIYMGGWALYKAELKKNLAKNMKPEEAKAKALEVFERVTDETQQSGRLSQQSYWQSNSFLRAFTMFQSSQNQYLRKEINAVRGVMTGRMSKKQAAKVLFIYHILLPCLFQFASDGFEWDWKAQLRAALLGSLNGIFILNGILERGLDVALGTADAWRATRTGLSDVLPFWGSVEDLYSFFVDLAEGDVDLEDYLEVTRAFIKPVGELTGIPLKYPLDVLQNFGNYAEDGEYGKEVLLWLGWSPYALRDKEEDY